MSVSFCYEKTPGKKLQVEQSTPGIEPGSSRIRAQPSDAIPHSRFHNYNEA